MPTYLPTYLPSYSLTYIFPPHPTARGGGERGFFDIGTLHILYILQETKKKKKKTKKLL